MIKKPKVKPLMRSKEEDDDMIQITEKQEHERPMEN
jgi:hypothetical protein